MEQAEAQWAREQAETKAQLQRAVETEQARIAHLKQLMLVEGLLDVSQQAPVPPPALPSPDAETKRSATVRTMHLKRYEQWSLRCDKPDVELELQPEPEPEPTSPEPEPESEPTPPAPEPTPSQPEPEPEPTTPEPELTEHELVQVQLEEQSVHILQALVAVAEMQVQHSADNPDPLEAAIKLRDQHEKSARASIAKEPGEGSPEPSSDRVYTKKDALVARRKAKEAGASTKVILQANLAIEQEDFHAAVTQLNAARQAIVQQENEKDDRKAALAARKKAKAAGALRGFCAMTCD